MLSRLTSGIASKPRTALEVRFDEVSIAGRKVLGSIRLEVNPGEVVLLVGRNGSGKSVLMKAIMGIEAIGVGRVAVFGREVDPPMPHILRQLGVGYLPQHRVVFEELTIEENLKVCCPSGVSVTQDLVPSVLGARLMERAGSLSGGERQILGMAMVRAANPRLMILDEPCAALTQDASSQMLQSLLSTCDGNGSAVLLIEQRISDALRIASRVICLENGGVAYSGPPSEFLFERKHGGHRIGPGD